MRIVFIGDVHGDWKDLQTVLDRLPEDMMVIQVGDFGFYRWALPKLKLDRTVHFIDGNHEDFPFLSKRVDFNASTPQPVSGYPNLVYLPRGSTMKIGGKVFGFMGGGNSVDRKQRQAAADAGKPPTWFAEEIPTEDEHARLLSVPKIDVMVTHDTPAETFDGGYITGNSKWDTDAYDHQNRDRLQTLLETVKPGAWVHGHFHQHYRTEIQGCTVIGLGVAPDTCVYDTEHGFTY